MPAGKEGCAVQCLVGLVGSRPPRLRVEPVTQALAQSASTLLRATGLHGHKYAIDARVCATALAQTGRVTILTSDVEDITVLTTDHSRVTAEKV